MADYKDVVSLPAWRGQVIAELFRMYRQGGFPNYLELGSTQPESDTARLAVEAAAAAGVHVIVRKHDGWRWWPEEATQDPSKKKSLRYGMNCLRRQGTVEARHVRDVAEWDSIKEEYYRQHSLRQLFAGRSISFDNPCKRAFFDALFQTPYAHVSALYLNGGLVACNYGYLGDGVLYLGALSFDVRQRQFSPNMLLIALNMTNAREWGLRGVDLTIGNSDLKERLGTSRKDLPWVEVYARPGMYAATRLRDAAVRAVRSLPSAAGHEEVWPEHIKPAVQGLVLKARLWKEVGLVRGVANRARNLLCRVFERRRGLVLVARPEDRRAIVPQLLPGERIEFHVNQIHDLVQWSGPGLRTWRQLSAQLQGTLEALENGRWFHTVLVNGRLAGWGYSYWPKEPVCLMETGSLLFPTQAHSVSLYDFGILPEFRGRKLYQALLSDILERRFAEGAERAYISVLEQNVPSLKAIERVGFRVIAINQFTRLLRWKKIRTTKVMDVL
jgi:RimJ/RimL family protein N-acetyltransferase